MATPASPIAPDLESGDIKRNGTAVVIVFISLPPSCCVLICAKEKFLKKNH
jgi:hypothetical protein